MRTQMGDTLHSSRRRPAEAGMTLIDTLIGSALMAIVFMGIAAVFQLSVEVVSNNKSRAGAVALANERMEYIRSLSYQSLGTVGGIPSGSLASTETISQNNITYTRRTTILYGDDPYDGLGAADTFPAGSATPLDYKIVRVDVAWPFHATERHVTIVTRIEPLNGTEITCSTPCGSAVVTVLNAASQPVSNARVDVTNSSVNPAVNLTTYTNSSGVASILGATVGSGYSIAVSKPGYSSDQTYSSSAQNPSPFPPHASISNNQTTSLTFGIDQLSEKTIVTRSKATGAQLANVPFRLRGAKYIGTNPTVYKYDQVLGTGGSGTTTVSNMEWDTYTISIDQSTGYDIASSCDAPQPQYLVPGTAQTTILYLSVHTSDSLLLDVRTSAGVLVPGASARLQRAGYDQTIVSDACGQAFFSGLVNASDYTLTLNGDGFATKVLNAVSVQGTTKLSAAFD